MRGTGRHLSDEEFVAALGRELRRRPRRGWLLAVGAALALLGVAWLLVLPNVLLARVSQAKAEGPPHRAVIAAVAIGASGAVFVLMGVRLLGDWGAAGQRRRMIELLAAGRGDGGQAGALTGR